jgi:hypothetical protein
VIIWLAAGGDRPRRGTSLAGFTAVLFVAAPIWWVPTSWRVTNHPPGLHQNYWQLFVGNSFLFAMLAFLAGVVIMLVRRSGVGGQLGAPLTIGPTDVELATEDLELVGSESSGRPAPPIGQGGAPGAFLSLWTGISELHRC